MNNERDFDLDWQRFPALMAHDLKGPIGNLVLYTNLAMDELHELEGANPDSLALLKKVMSQVHDTGEKLLFQVQSWVDAHFLIRGVYQRKDELFDIQSLMEQTVDQVMPEFSMRNVKLVLQPVTSFKIFSDPVLLRNSIKNLLYTVALFGVTGDMVRVWAHVHEKEAIFDIEFPASPGMERVIGRLNIDFRQTRQVDTTEGLMKTGVFGMVYTNLAIHQLKGSILQRDTGHRTAFSLVVPTGI